MVAIMLGVVGRWAHNENAIPPAKNVLQIVFALLVLSMLDQGQTQPIARGFAWIFLVAVCLSNNSPLTGLAKATGSGTSIGQSIVKIGSTK